MGWEIKKIKDVALVIAGQSPEGKYYNSEGEGMPFYQGKKEFTDKYIGNPVVWTSKVTKIAKEGDVLMSVRAPVGPVNFATQECCIGRGLASIRVFENFNKDFLFHFFKNVESRLEGNSGAVFNSINKSQIEGIQIPIPPLEEQQKIVEKLDKAFEYIDQAKANIEQNIINAKELFQSKLDEVFSQKGDGWQEMRLGEFSKITYGCTEKALQEDTGIKYLRITDINNGTVDWDVVPFCQLSSLDEEKYKLIDGDIVFARTGATTGKSFIYHDNVNSVYASYLIRLQVRDTQKVNPDFVYWYFQSGEYWRTIKTGMTGSTLGGFNAKKLGEMLLHFPANIDIQKHLIDEFVRLQDDTNRIINLYQQKLSNLEELRKSILEKAFKGELTH